MKRPRLVRMMQEWCCKNVNRHVRCGNGGRRLVDLVFRTSRLYSRGAAVLPCPGGCVDDAAPRTPKHPLLAFRGVFFEHGEGGGAGGGGGSETLCSRSSLCLSTLCQPHIKCSWSWYLTFMYDISWR